MTVSCLPSVLQDILGSVGSILHARSAFRLPWLILGVLFAKGRRTVTSWLRAASLQEGFPNYYYFLGSLGEHPDTAGLILLRKLVNHLPPETSFTVAIDDSPTPRYGPHVQGAGIHHNPTPGPANHAFLYGHCWVYISLLVSHTDWGVISFPLNVRLYVREKDVPKLPSHYRWQFQTKTQLAAELLAWLRVALPQKDRSVRLVADGAYAKRIVLKAAASHRIDVISRLRCDASLWSVPVRSPNPGRGQPRKYGSQRIRLALRAGQRRGWQEVEVWQYGRVQRKRIKSFEATWRPAGGKIRVVLVQEEQGWLAFFSTEASKTAEEILEAMADRFAIEEMFANLKEVEGLGQQQVRNLYANLGVVLLCNWEYSLVELWSWERSHEELVDRSDSPWDRLDRRPSHADRRKALQECCRDEEYREVVGDAEVGEEMQAYIQRLRKAAA